ncbi:phage major structural protein, partial [Lacticaseibacillus rhamnosus]
GYKTYDHLPMQQENAPYPFVIVGDIQVVPTATKTSLNGNVLITIDIWGDKKQRFTISDMAERFFRAAIGQVLTDDYRFYGRVEDQSKEFTQDQSVPDTVLNRATLILNLNIL